MKNSSWALRATKRRILFLSDIVGAVDGADLADLVGVVMSDEAHRSTFQKLLARMVGKGLLSKEGFGVYRSTGKHRRYGFDGFTSYETKIINFLRTQPCGEAEAKAIFALWGARPRRERGSVHDRVYKVLRESPWIVNSGEGLWKLAPGGDDSWKVALL